MPTAGGPLRRGRRDGRASVRRIAFLVHSVLGLKLSLLLLFVCATGTVAVVSDELEWLFWPAVRATPTDHPVSWGDQLAAVRGAYPDHDVTYVVAGEAPYLANEFEVVTPAGELRYVYVDAATGRITGESGFIRFRSVLRGVHYYLLLPGNWGFYPVTFLGFVLLASLISGLMTFPRFWRRAFRLPRWDRGGRIFWGELHRLGGVWLSAFVLVIAGTSIWYMAERMMEGAGVPLEIDRTPIPEERLDRFGPAPPEPLPLDTLLARARAAIPGLEIKHIWLPEHADMPLFVRGQATAQLVRDRGNGAQLDPYTGDVLAAYTAEALPPLPRWVQTADPLHFGDFGGLATKVLWFLCGTGMCGIMAVGAVVYGRRTADAIGRSSPGRPRDARRRATASLRDVRAALRFRHMGRWRLPAALAVSAVPAVAYLTWWAPQFESRVEATALPAAPVGPWTVSARTDHPLPPAPGEGLSWRLRFCPGCYKSVRSAWVAFGNAEGPTSAPVRVLGSPNELQATIKAPAAIAAEGLHLWVIVNGWNGSRYRASWTIQATHGSLR